MKALKYLSFVGKVAGLVSALQVIPFVDPAVGVLVFVAASILKDTVNRIGDLVDDGLPNQSFKSCAAPMREFSTRYKSDRLKTSFSVPYFPLGAA